jgi:hypothetical protein
MLFIITFFVSGCQIHFVSRALTRRQRNPEKLRSGVRQTTTRRQQFSGQNQGHIHIVTACSNQYK